MSESAFASALRDSEREVKSAVRRVLYRDSEYSAFSRAVPARAALSPLFGTRSDTDEPLDSSRNLSSSEASSGSAGTRISLGTVGASTPSVEV